VDYVPTLFVFTREEQRTALGKRVKKHEQMIAMKKKKFDGLRRSELDENFDEESDDPLIVQSTEETAAVLDGDFTENETDSNVLVTDKDEELQKVLQQIEELKSIVAEKEAANKEIRRTVTRIRFDVRGKKLERKINEVCEKNADLEEMNAELKERIST